MINKYVLIKKCQAFPDLSVDKKLLIGGCLTPVEVLFLFSLDGVEPNDMFWYNQAIKNKKEGVCRPRWYYIKSTNVQLNDSITNKRQFK